MSTPVLGLIVPPAAGEVPPDAAALYPQYRFIAEGLGVTEMSSAGFDPVVGSVGAAAERLALRGAAVIAVMGTSLSFYRGAAFNDQLQAEIARRTGLPTLTMSSAMLQALRVLGLRRVAVATAYEAPVNAAFRAFMALAGMEILSLEALGVASIAEVHRVPPEVVTDLGRRALAAAPGAEGLVISCGGLLTRPAVSAIEAETGLPVVTSPLAGLWATVALAGLDPMAPGEGRLFAAPVAATVGEG